MSPSLDDLRIALEAHAEDAWSTTATDRVHGVRRHVAARRRARSGAVAAGAAVLLVATVAVGTGVFARSTATPPPPAGSHDSHDSRNPIVNGLPEYADGGRQIGSARVAIPAAGGVVHLFTATPTSYQLTLRMTCTGAHAVDDIATVLVNGTQDVGGSCAGGAVLADTGRFVGAAALWRSSKVRLGQPVRIDVQMPVGITGPGTVAVGLYQGVPLADYPFPARPRHVAPPRSLVSSVGSPRPITLPGGQAQGEWTSTVTYRPDLEIIGTATAPGLVVVSVNGVVVDGSATWDYGVNGYELSLDPTTITDAGGAAPASGERVTIRVQIERFAQADWQLALGHRVVASPGSG